MGDFMTKSFYKQRAEFNEQTKVREKTMTFPSDVHEYADIFYANDGLDAHRLDIFCPKEHTDKKLPVIIDVHGGGLLLGNKEFNRYFCAQLSRMGFLVFSIEFRLVPEFQVYDQFADFSMAMDFIQTQIPAYQGDLSHVYVVADSGGAYIATYGVAMQNCKALADAAGVTPSSLKVHALGLISGMFYTTKPDKIGIFLPKYLYGKDYKKNAFAPYTNPEHPDIIRALPPCWLVTSRDDNLSHYTLNYEKALSKYGVEHELMNFPKNPKLTHAFCVFEPFMNESIEAMESMAQFLRKYPM